MLRHIGSPITPRPMNPTTGLFVSAFISCPVQWRRCMRSCERGVKAPVQTLDLLVQAQPTDALFAPETTVFETAERRGNGELRVGVNPHRSGIQPASNAPGALIVAGPDSRRQPVYRVVCLRDKIVFAVERKHAENGAKDLLLADGCSVAQTCHDRRKVIRA